MRVFSSRYDGRTVPALAFISPDEFATVSGDLLPTQRYMRLISVGARQMRLQASYCDWLDQVPVIDDKSRGSAYYACGGTGASTGVPKARDSGTSKRKDLGEATAQRSKFVKSVKEADDDHDLKLH